MKEEKEILFEEKLYAKLVEAKDFKKITKSDLTFFNCDYIARCVEGPFEGMQTRLSLLGNEIKIGSKDDCQFYLQDETVSPHHCTLTCIPNSFFYKLQDNKSDSGTWLKISNLEESYEIKNDTLFKLFNNIILVKVPTKIKNYAIIEVVEGPQKGLVKKLSKDDSSVQISKTKSHMNLEMNCDEHLTFTFTNVSNRIYVVDETTEITKKGLYYKLPNNETAIIRAGDMFQVGKSTFRILMHNWAKFSEIGDRNSQEDKICIIDDLRIFNDIVVPYYAVYDGHGGSTCSTYLKEVFHKNLHDYLKLKNLSNSENFIIDLCHAIQEVVIYTDLTYFQNEKTFSGDHGSTCVFLMFIGTYILCCNLGDSISILWKNTNQKIYLSRDFKPYREVEEKRIHHKKGFVTKDGRLLGTISVSRAFGDWKFKDKEMQKKLHDKKSNEEFGEYLISNRAEFRIIEINPNEDEYAILISDGIFQHDTPERIFQTINESLSNEKTEGQNIKSMINVADNIRFELVNQIYNDKNMDGKADNMTMILVHFQNDNC